MVSVDTDGDVPGINNEVTPLALCDSEILLCLETVDVLFKYNVIQICG